MTSANTVLFSEDAPSETPGQLSKKKSSRDSAFALLSRAPTNLSQSGGAGGSTSSPKTSQRSPGSKPLASRPSPSRAPTSGTQGAAASQDGELPAYMGRGRRTVKPWKPSTPHPSHVEEREPKGWSLSHILSKATWSMKLSKAFAPHLTPGGDPNAVRVGVRMRPMNDYEIKRGEREKSKEFIKTSGTQLRISNPRPPPGQEAKTDEFAYDALFLPEDNTAKVFKELALPLVHLLVEGFNGTIFAYGQTGSGKTHSMMGNASDPGITPRVVAELFEVLGRLDGSQTTFSVRCSYLQIYREVLHDLLGGKAAKDVSANELKIRRDPERGIYVQGLTEQTLDSAQGLSAIIEVGNKKRSVAATLMNAESSRSHAVIILVIERHDAATKQRKARTFRAKLNLVDLAGSERVVKSGATGETLKEAIAINQSLSMLGTVINALTDVRAASHIPYRSSKLTYLLEESLGGNSHTVMLAACSPSIRSYFETLSTLQYAVRAKMIVTNPKANYDIDHAAEVTEAEAAPAKRSPEFYYLPRFVRDYEKHHPDQPPLSASPTRSAKAGGHSARSSPSPTRTHSARI